jgi:hypothetical protein
MRPLLSTLLLVLFTVTNTNAFVLPRADNTTSSLPDSQCLNSNSDACESSWDRVPTGVKAIIFIAAFLALGFIVLAYQKLKIFIKPLLPSWMRSRTNEVPPSQMELNMCWERYGPKDGEGKPRAGSAKDLSRLWRKRGEGMRFEVLAEGPRRGERAPFIVGS